MGSLQLDCPLCCSETFPCHDSLKYHLLSIADNLICPSCGKRFERIVDLALHLGRKCEEVDEYIVHSVKEEADVSSLNVTNLNNDSILAKALMKKSVTKSIISHERMEEEEHEESNETQSAEEDTYYCSTCAITFTSIQEHLQNHHQGHEVFVQEEEEESGILLEDEMTQVEEQPEDDDEVEEEDCDKELLKTVQEEECVDKDGRLYTRKMVKIKKFWYDKEPNDENSSITLTGDISQETVVLENSAGFENSDDSILYRCSICLKKFRTMELYTKHKCIADKHKKCKTCNATFENLSLLLAHVKMHQSNTMVRPIDPRPPFTCEICKTEFSTYKSLRLHKRMHEPIKSKDIEPPVNYGMLGEVIDTDNVYQEMFICEICNKSYNKEYEEAHKHFHSKEADFNCEICNRKFFTKENLEMHMRAHSDAKKFVCSYCKKGFLTKEKLEEHMSSKCQKRQYECRYCGRRFARPHEKVKHERIHTGEKPHVCAICGKAFRVSYCLTLHMRTHSGTRPYKCEHCGKRFKAHSVYNHHLLTHYDDRKYKCTYCPKTFKTGVQLAGHKNSHIKPFTCTECNRPFASLYAVRAHMETHQRRNNLNFRCWLCGASYARAFALRDHMKEQHQQDAEGVVLEGSEIGVGENNVRSGAAVLEEADETMLLDLGGESVVNNLEILEGQGEEQVADS